MKWRLFSFLMRKTDDPGRKKLLGKGSSLPLTLAQNY